MAQSKSAQHCCTSANGSSPGIRMRPPGSLGAALKAFLIAPGPPPSPARQHADGIAALLEHQPQRVDQVFVALDSGPLAQVIFRRVYVIDVAEHECVWSNSQPAAEKIRTGPVETTGPESGIAEEYPGMQYAGA